MTAREEAERAAERMADEHFRFRTDATPRTRQGFVLREAARLLGEPVPSGRDMPRSVRKRRTLEPETVNLEALLARSIKEVQDGSRSRGAV